MKKVLFGICALALSATVFGATSAPIVTGEDTVVGLPVNVEARVVDGSNSLFIEGSVGADNYGTSLYINFGDLSHGETKDPIPVNVRVYKGTNTTGTAAAALGNDIEFYLGKVDTNSKFDVNTSKDIVLSNTNGDGSTIDSHLTLVNISYANGGTSKEASECNAVFRATIDAVEYNSSDANDTSQTEGTYSGMSTLYAKLPNIPIGG